MTPPAPAMSQPENVTSEATKFSSVTMMAPPAAMPELPSEIVKPVIVTVVPACTLLPAPGDEIAETGGVKSAEAAAATIESRINNCQPNDA